MLIVAPGGLRVVLHRHRSCGASWRFRSDCGSVVKLSATSTTIAGKLGRSGRARCVGYAICAGFEGDQLSTSGGNISVQKSVSSKNLSEQLYTN